MSTLNLNLFHTSITRTYNTQYEGIPLTIFNSMEHSTQLISLSSTNTLEFLHKYVPHTNRTKHTIEVYLCGRWRNGSTQAKQWFSEMHRWYNNIKGSLNFSTFFAGYF